MSSPPRDKQWAGFARSSLVAGAAVLTATSDVLAEDLALIAREWVTCLKAGGKILLFGNGGSHADAQHLAGELVNRFRRNRPGMAALALGTSVPNLTSVANDAAFEEVFAREVEAFGLKGDVAVGLSTSGNSPNVVRALKTAQNRDLLTQAFTGEAGGPVARAARKVLRVPSSDTPLVQQAHMALGHILCDLVESTVFPPHG